MASLPLRYFRSFQRIAHEQPVLLWSLIIGAMGPVTLIVVPPLRRKLGYSKDVPIPSTYPLPRRPRRDISGFDDES